MMAITRPTPAEPCGRLPFRLDPFGQINGLTVNARHRLRFLEGGEGEGSSGDDGGDGEASDDSAGSEGEEQLGDAGKKALDAMKTDRNKYRDQLKAFTDIGLTVDEIKNLKNGTAQDVEFDQDKFRADLTTEITNSLREGTHNKLRAAEVRAQAAELGFIKPSQALALLNKDELEKVTVGDDDVVDTAAVTKLLEALSKESSYLLKQSTTADHRTAGIGSTGSGAKPEVQPGTPRLRSAYENNSK